MRSVIRSLSAVLAPFVALVALDAGAQVFGPSGAAFQVNTNSVFDQQRPAVGIDGMGRFFIVWTSPDGDSGGIFGRRFNQGGTPIDGADFLINANTTGDHDQAGVAGTGDGNFVVVWQRATATQLHADAQRYNALAPAGAPFIVYSSTSKEPRPSVALDGSSNAVVVWAEVTVQGTEVGGQLYGSSGGAVGGPFQPSQTNSSGFPAVARASTGEFAVVWSTYSGMIMARRYDAMGSALGGEFRVNELTGTDVLRPRVAASGAGFVVTWSRYVNDTNVKARLYGWNGAPLTGEFRVNTYSTGFQGEPEVAMDSAGDFVVVWDSFQYVGTDTTVFAQRYANGGTPLGSEFRVGGPAAAGGYRPKIGMAANGDFVVAWARLGTTTGTDIYAQRYCHALAGDADGNGKLDVGDVFYLINALFAGGPAPVHAADANGDGLTDVADVFFLINYLFAGGGPPACPFTL